MIRPFLEGADTSLNDWFAFAAARSGYKEDYKAIEKRWKQRSPKIWHKKKNSGKSDRISESGTGDRAALGGDPQAVSDMAGEKSINLIADGTYNRGKTERFDTQGTNALIWALMRTGFRGL